MRDVSEPNYTSHKLITPQIKHYSMDFDSMMVPEPIDTANESFSTE